MLHRSLTHDGSRLEVKEKATWRASDPVTGLGFCTLACLTRTEALKGLAERLEHIDIGRMANAISRSAEVYGVIPGWEPLLLTLTLLYCGNHESATS